ncbi:MAG TPA: hypothetical protein V6C84_27370 [Coleofasciculaceae cyanobacterium]
MMWSLDYSSIAMSLDYLSSYRSTRLEHYQFPTAYYEAHGHLTCPNGDKLRSDAEGLFCWVEGDRQAAKVVNGRVELIPVPKAKKPAEDKKDANG